MQYTVSARSTGLCRLEKPVTRTLRPCRIPVHEPAIRSWPLLMRRHWLRMRGARGSILRGNGVAGESGARKPTPRANRLKAQMKVLAESCQRIRRNSKLSAYIERRSAVSDRTDYAPYYPAFLLMYSPMRFSSDLCLLLMKRSIRSSLHFIAVAYRIYSFDKRH